MNTAFNWSHIYAVESMHYANLTKNGKHVNIQAGFHMHDCVCDFQM